MKKLLLVSILLFTSPLFASMTCYLTTGTSGAHQSPYTVHIAADLTEWAAYGVTSNFDTFCVEGPVLPQVRYFNPSNPSQNKYYYYTATVDDVVKYGGSQSTLDEMTKKIYSSFLNGTLALSAGKIQNAIWHAEGTANYQSDYNDVIAAMGDTAGYENVMVLNLWHGDAYTGGDKQSQLVRIVPVPAPGAVLLGGFGMTFIGWLKKRKSL